MLSMSLSPDCPATDVGPIPLGPSNYEHDWSLGVCPPVDSEAILTALMASYVLPVSALQ